MITWKERVAIVLFSIALNLALLYAYGRFVKPAIDEAAKGMAAYMLHQGVK